MRVWIVKEENNDVTKRSFQIITVFPEIKNGKKKRSKYVTTDESVSISCIVFCEDKDDFASVVFTTELNL